MIRRRPIPLRTIHIILSRLVPWMVMFSVCYHVVQKGLHESVATRHINAIDHSENMLGVLAYFDKTQEMIDVLTSVRNIAVACTLHREGCAGMRVSAYNQLDAMLYALQFEREEYHSDFLPSKDEHLLLAARECATPVPFDWRVSKEEKESAIGLVNHIDVMIGLDKNISRLEEYVRNGAALRESILLNRTHEEWRIHQAAVAESVELVPKYIQNQIARFWDFVTCGTFSAPVLTFAASITVAYLFGVNGQLAILFVEKLCGYYTSRMTYMVPGIAAVEYNRNEGFWGFVWHIMTGGGAHLLPLMSIMVLFLLFAPDWWNIRYFIVKTLRNNKRVNHVLRTQWIGRLLFAYIVNPLADFHFAFAAVLLTMGIPNLALVVSHRFGLLRYWQVNPVSLDLSGFVRGCTFVLLPWIVRCLVMIFAENPRAIAGRVAAIARATPFLLTFLVNLAGIMDKLPADWLSYSNSVSGVPVDNVAFSFLASYAEQMAPAACYMFNVCRNVVN